MTFDEIIKSKKIQLEVAPKGKSFYAIDGKKLKSKVKTVLYYGEKSWIASNSEVSIEYLFFSLVKKSKIPVPSDYSCCSKCNGKGLVNYRMHDGICFSCNGLGYFKINK